MGTRGKLEVDIDLKSKPDKFWETIRNSTDIFPKAFPTDYKSIDILEGDGKAAGSIRHITYAEGSPIVKSSKEKILAADDTKKTVSYAVIEGDLLKYYDKFIGHITVTPSGEGSEVKWTAEYHKASPDVPDPTVVKDFAVKNFLEVDAYVLANA
ncbi:MLP-like protein 423 [Cajanus cajan]|uniref:MLP-like protein 423 family n=1 Tax=Cajanus cajan TaxID=3821 RepID=A0A151TGL6_CAJCA|nr:MLP-like protein 423 [Cajanus cajan]KYP66195.1 MLP-like protein 423 family [Cajanus cajan]